MQTTVPTFRLQDPGNTMVNAVEKARTGEFGVVYVGHVEGAALHWLLLLEPFSIRVAAGCLQQRHESERSDGRSVWERRFIVCFCVSLPLRAANSRKPFMSEKTCGCFSFFVCIFQPSKAHSSTCSCSCRVTANSSDL